MTHVILVSGHHDRAGELPCSKAKNQEKKKMVKTQEGSFIKSSLFALEHIFTITHEHYHIKDGMDYDYEFYILINTYRS